MPQRNAASMQPRPPERSSGDAQNKPVEKFTDGPVHVSIWENTGTRGMFRAASFELRFRDKDDQWKSGYNYTSVALKSLESAAREARSRIEAWQQQNPQTANPRP
jgi:hypothetical protein